MKLNLSPAPLALMMYSTLLILIGACKRNSDDPAPPPPANEPVITGFTPATGPVGIAVNINGTGFSTNKAELTVKVNGTPATIGVSDATEISITIPVGATTGKITVERNGKIATSQNNFTVTPGQNPEPVWTISGFAGSGQNGSDDGVANLASFRGPKSLAKDAQGNIYVADALANKIRRISPNGDVFTIAGTGLAGSANGDGRTEASFRSPTGIVVDANGNIYVADQGNHLIRRISPAGVVRTISGTGIAGSTDGAIATASFNSPYALAMDAQGSLYVSDNANHRIRKIAGGTVTTIAGNGQATSTNGQGINAGIPWPGGMAFDTDGNLYVTEKGAGKIRKINAAGNVTTIGGTLSVNTEPTGIAIDKDNNLYELFRGMHKIKLFTQAGVEANFIGTGDPGNDDGVAGKFQHPEGLLLIENAQGEKVFYIGDTDNKKIRKVSRQL